MTHQSDDLPPELEQYLALCHREYQRMVREGRWPWAETVTEDLSNEPKRN